MIGLAMLVSVLFIMGQLLVDWGHGRASSSSFNSTTAALDDTSTTTVAIDDTTAAL